MTCRNSLGDSLCGINLETYRVNFTVLAVLDPFTIVVNDLHGKVDGYYALGQAVWDTGSNAGAASEVQTSMSLTNELGFFWPPAATVVIGDTGHVYPGCDLLIGTCQSKFNNAVNFNGEPYNPQPIIVTSPPSTVVSPATVPWQ